MEKRQLRRLIFHGERPAEASVLLIANGQSRRWWGNAVVLILLALTCVLQRGAQAQTFTVIHAFTGGGDGWGPLELTEDAAGNLYGTTVGGGSYTGDPCTFFYGCGVVFRLARKNTSWILSPVYTFTGGDDGARPQATVTVGPDGDLYGTTSQGGGLGTCSNNHGCGTVFKLQPPPTICKTALCPWNETVLYRFQPEADGNLPESPVTFDPAGNLYGTTNLGGLYLPCLDGTVYQLTGSEHDWTEQMIYFFCGGFSGDGAYPISGVIFDTAGNLYGTTPTGGPYFPFVGMVYELSPSELFWTEERLYSFEGENDGELPSGALVMDPAGNLYGATSTGRDSYSGATIYELSPSNGGWIYTVLYTWPPGEPGGRGGLTMDRAGNLYGATKGFPTSFGELFKLTHSESGWTYSVLHRFSGLDGMYPNGSPLIDSNGTLLGTVQGGGPAGYGVVFQITP